MPDPVGTLDKDNKLIAYKYTTEKPSDGTKYEYGGKRKDGKDFYYILDKNGQRPKASRN